MRFRQLLFLFFALAHAALFAQTPAITSLHSTAGLESPILGNAITSGTSLDLFYLIIQGSFDVERVHSVRWTNTSTNVTTTFFRSCDGYCSVGVSSTLIGVEVPASLFSTVVSSPITVNVTVTELRGEEEIESNARPFLLNPPMAPVFYLPDAQRGVAYAQPLITGGTGPFTVEVENPAQLPPGMNVPSNDPTLRGTPSSIGNYNFPFTVEDAWGNVVEDALAYVYVYDPPVVTALSPPSRVAGSGSFQLTVTGSNFVAMSSSAVSGNGVDSGRGLLIPRGESAFPLDEYPLSFSSQIIFAGTPLSTTLVNSTTLTATVPGSLIATPGSKPVLVRNPDYHSSNTVYFQVTPPLTISTSALKNGRVGMTYSDAIFANGGTPEYAFALASGTLPDGLKLWADGLLAGTPTKAGTFRFSVRVTDSDRQSDLREFSLLIQPVPLTVTGSVSDVALGAQVNIVFGATGGTPPYSFQVSGRLPTGTQFSGSTLSGTTTATGKFEFQVTVTDSARVTASKGFVINVFNPPLELTGTPGNGQAGTPYSASFGATGGTPPYAFTATGIPAGLRFENGILSGTPTTAGTFELDVTVKDAASGSDTKHFSIVIAGPPLSISTASLPNGTLGASYSATLAATGGAPPYTWSISGVPAGLTAAATGIISGTPTATGSFTVNATVTDSKGATASRSFTLTLSAPRLEITTASLPGAIAGTAYSGTVEALGGLPPYSWTATGLPTGVSLSNEGSFSGTPSQTGSANLTVTVQDSAGNTASRSYALTIALPTSPTVNLGGPSTSNPGTQPPFQIGLGAPYPGTVDVTLTLTFAPDSGADDPSVQFMSGGRTVRFTIPAGSTTTPDVAIQTGTVAGTATITARLTAFSEDVTPTPVPTRTIRINPVPPVISSMTAVRTSTGFTVTITGFASARDITQAQFTFTAAPGANLQTTQITVPVESIFTQWWNSTAAAPFGSQFTFSMPFTVSGSTESIASISVTLVSRTGNSTAANATLQ